MEKSLISNPPYNMKWTIPPFAGAQSRFCEYELPPESNANFAFILTALDLITDKAAFLLPCGVLDTNNKAEANIRRNLIERNLVEAVIVCPDKMFEATSIATCILLFNKHKQTPRIEMIDLRERYEVETREQNGQYGGESHTNRTYKKEVKVFTWQIIADVQSCIKEQRDSPGYCRSVYPEQIEEQGYRLSPAKYIDQEIREVQTRNYEDIICDLNRVVKDKNLCKLTINETLARGIGLDELAELMKESQKSNTEMNKQLKFLEMEIEKENYLTLTKRKNEIKFENGSKEELSSIFMMIFQMWKQHIYFLNNEENRYLAELRDKLLPDLMSGKVQLGA